ncbi:hypothetical protein OPV22_011502 [Ensete ventricosum]|uniref:Fibronectin type III-like domain-containing protein n=1 Tax=Ensete ventricosum TaxID=4639 RepID=A0AAV8PXJ5_ENSVE|nr:hypothetical protein OPV22_011502 [Ensete ventricosum]
MGTRGLIFSSALLLLLLARTVLVISATPPFACDPANPSTRTFGFCNTTLPIDKRVSDLISRLTLEEKIQQLDDETPAIPRLGVPKYNWWSEALHGVSSWGHGIHFDRIIPSATSFPQVILTAASFNPDLWYRIGQTIAVEARALYNAGHADGLTFWSPNVNIFRDPRWGRGQETPGEDPVTASKYAVAFVRGLQGDSPTGERSGQLMTSSCCKHFTAYDLDNWNGINRHIFNAKVTAQDMEDTFQPPFKSCVEEGRATCVMCSYNEVNGVPTCADYNLLTKQAKKEWGLDGYIASDCAAVDYMYGATHYAKTLEEAVSYALKAGVDINCGKAMKQHLGSAIQKGNISESDIDKALSNALSLRMKLGLFNGDPQKLPSGDIPPSQVCSTQHKNLALQAAQEGIVLLKNNGNTLPLVKSKITSLGVIGPNADAPPSLLGNYNGPPCEVITPLKALQSSVNNTRFIAGSNVPGNVTQIPEAVQLASSVDYVIMFMGLDQHQEREAFDRTDLVLPGMQQTLISKVAEAAKKPIILVLISGGPLDITFAKDDPRIGAILWAGFPGEAGGSAISSIIFGDHNPGGKLPVTWYPQEFTKVPMTDMRMRPDPATGYPGRSYRFYTGKTVYQFGYGLSYSNYSYEFEAEAATSIYLNNSLSPQATSNDPNTLSYDIASLGFHTCGELKVSAKVGVKNHGPMAGKHPVLLFSRWPSTEHGRLVKQLVGFQSVHLEAGESTKVEFPLSACEHLSRVMDDGRRVLDKGSHFLIVGDKEHEINIVS